jgi:hypothetical protein
MMAAHGNGGNNGSQQQWRGATDNNQLKGSLKK